MVAGLNRSGTSVLTGALARCGVAISFQHDALQAGLRKEDAARLDGGYESFEVPAILSFVRGITARAGGHQGNPPASGDIELSVVDELAILSLLDLIPSFPFAIKDPLLTFQFRQWKAVVQANRPKIVVEAVVSMRHPVQQAHALLARGFCSDLKGGLEQWLRYYGEVRDLIEVGERPYIVRYDGNKRRFASQLRSLCRSLGLVFQPAAVAELFRPNASRRVNLHEVKSHPLWRAIIDLYEVLCDHSLAARDL